MGSNNDNTSSMVNVQACGNNTTDGGKLSKKPSRTISIRVNGLLRHMSTIQSLGVNSVFNSELSTVCRYNNALMNTITQYGSQIRNNRPVT